MVVILMNDNSDNSLNGWAPHSAYDIDESTGDFEYSPQIPGGFYVTDDHIYFHLFQLREMRQY